MRKRILICDDDQGILDMLSLLLKNYGFDIFAEQDSLQVEASIHLFRPDLVLLDLWMPHFSGDQVVDKLRSNPLTATLPVIILSASKDGRSIALEAGANDYMEKPFDIIRLVGKINGAVK